MEPGALADLARRFRFNERFLGTLTKDLGPDDWTARPPAGGNSAHWIVGHVAHFRRVALRTLGVDVPEAEWERSFAMGAKPSGSETMPRPEELVKAIRESGAALESRLLSISPEEADAPAPRARPDGSTTRAGVAGFLHVHETYHLGQLGYLRRTRGKPGFL